MGNRFGSVQVMLPHRPFGEPSPPKPPPKRRRRNTQPMDLAWLEERALRYASRWEASAAGVTTLLERKVSERCEQTGEAPDLVLEMIPALVTKLVEKEFVDDHRFASGVLERQRRRGDSTTRIRARLTAKGISESLLDELFAEEDPEIEIQAAWKLARRRRLGPYCSDPTERRQTHDRHLGILCRQGFDLKTALRIVDADEPPESS
jgi:regulatory protein